jgi:acid phosphatase family membrane protein YuiD
MPVHAIGLLALASGLAAQALKVVISLVFRRRWQPLLILSSGGMPSSHTAVVTTLCFLVGEREGVGSPLFSIVLIFSLYVIFEATGLRQEVGKQARLLNEMTEAALAGERWPRPRLRELVGHTWGEVAAGFVCGILFYVLGRSWAV